jgi:hypothetical protein
MNKNPCIWANWACGIRIVLVFYILKTIISNKNIKGPICLYRTDYVQKEVWNSYLTTNSKCRTKPKLC